MTIVESDGDAVDVGNWRWRQACVDYIVYVCPLPAFDAFHWQERVKRLRALGICQDTAFGVTTVRGPWGFFQIPVHGFPEMKVTFFQIAGTSERRRLLVEIAAILEEG